MKINWSLIIFLSFISAPQVFSKTIKIKWAIAHEPKKYVIRTANTFKETLNKLDTVNNYEIEIVDLLKGPSKFGYQEETITMIEKNDYQMGQIYSNSISRKFNIPNYNVFELPYLVNSDDHFSDIVEGSIGDSLLAELDKTKIKGLAFTYSGGFYAQITKSPITKLEDLKKQVILTNNDHLKAVYKDLGILSFKTRDFPALKKNNKDFYNYIYRKVSTVIDAKYADFERENRWKKFEKIYDNPYFVDSKHSMLTTVVISNKKFLKGLPESDQKKILKAIKIAASEERKAIVAEANKIISKFKAKNRYLKYSKSLVREITNASERVRKTSIPGLSEDLIKKIKDHPVRNKVAGR